MEIPLTQVQTAMSTWVNDGRIRSIRSTRKSLQELVDIMQSPYATDRRAFIKALTDHEEIAQDEASLRLGNLGGENFLAKLPPARRE